MVKLEHWDIIIEYIADYDGQIRDLQQFIRKGDKIRVLRKKEA